MEDPMVNDSRSAAPMRGGQRRGGQMLAELGITLGFLLVLILAILEVGYLIYQQYDAINLAREAANLILRDNDLDVAEAAIRAAQLTRTFDSDVKLILSVVQLGSVGPSTNKPIIINRHVAGTLDGTSVLGDPPSSAYGPGPSYIANDPARDTSIQARTPLPHGLRLNAGESVFVAEVYVKRRDILRMSATDSPSLYAAAFF
jgi:TadE-like protein